MDSLLAHERILIVDDQHTYATMLCTWLEQRYGLQVECLYTSHAAQRRLQADPPISLLIVDEDLGGTSGAELVAWARTQPTVQALLVVVHSLHMKSDIEMLYAAGAESFDLYVEKPIALNVLVQRLATLVHDRRT